MFQRFILDFKRPFWCWLPQEDKGRLSLDLPGNICESGGDQFFA
jgi:hypothetical protein